MKFLWGLTGVLGFALAAMILITQEISNTSRKPMMPKGWRTRGQTEANRVVVYMDGTPWGTKPH